MAVVGADGDADGGLERDGDAAQGEGLLQRAVQAGGDLGHGAAVGDVGQEDRELVAAEAGQDVLAAQDGAQARGDVDEQLVAVVVARACR